MRANKIRQLEGIGKVCAPCEWCGLTRECDAERKLTVKVRYISTMFEPAPYQCPDHEPIWWQGLEGVRP